MKSHSRRGRNVDWSPRLVRVTQEDRIVAITLGHPLLDDYLRFVGARARTNTWLAVAYDLKVFFSIITKEPAEVTTADVFTFISVQRSPLHGTNVVRLDDGERGLAARTIKRRLSSVSGLFSYLQARGEAHITTNPVPRGLPTRRPTRLGAHSVPLIRAPRTMPRVLTAGEVDGFSFPPGSAATLSLKLSRCG